ncbi:hypothetical protein ACF3DV_29280 [Chlorogloeopsis fritschii PCC 9212]|uniref:Uncharacterized protein n=1 Tax=Chlorogloeopsis fritschii PCC 6912 TaxID=211165 RepID=A0A3S1FPM5_CHLFR|nr:hypothetical protein [Chlorogloeopsis fritschii]RUR83141.1 hypothetical protein PCC6912_25150 [Chlorogloeopsis fritschii PCC 6912]
MFSDVTYKKPSLDHLLFADEIPVIKSIYVIRLRLTRFVGADLPSPILPWVFDKLNLGMGNENTIAKNFIGKIRYQLLLFVAKKTSHLPETKLKSLIRKIWQQLNYCLWQLEEFIDGSWLFIKRLITGIIFIGFSEGIILSELDEIGLRILKSLDMEDYETRMNSLFNGIKNKNCFYELLYILTFIYTILCLLVFINQLTPYINQIYTLVISILYKLIPTSYIPNILIYFLFLILFVFLLIFLINVLTVIPIRILSRIRDVEYCESTALVEILRILFELARDNALTEPIARESMIYRTERLAYLTRLIPFKYPYKNYSISQHFINISELIREKGKLLFIPTESTLPNLRNDFYKLAGIFITGYYGNFNILFPEFQIVSVEPTPLKTKKGGKLIYLIQGIGFMIPLIVLVCLMVLPNLENFLHIKPNYELLFLLSISWLLLGIDSYLKLGVTKSFIDFVKGLKELA